MTRSLPAPPADDLFSDDDFRSPMDIARTEARRNNGRKVVCPVVVEAAPVVETVRCTRCGRKLTSESSRARRTGRICEAKLQAAFTLIGETFSARQIEAATELISDGGVVVGPGKSCLTVSSRGDEVYAVDPWAGTCTCKAGQFGRLCYHICAALALTI